MPSNLDKAIAKAQIERMLNTPAYRLVCEVCQRETIHWLNHSSKEAVMVVACAQCGNERNIN